MVGLGLNVALGTLYCIVYGIDFVGIFINMMRPFAVCVSGTDRWDSVKGLEWVRVGKEYLAMRGRCSRSD